MKNPCHSVLNVLTALKITPERSANKLRWPNASLIVHPSLDGETCDSVEMELHRALTPDAFRAVIPFAQAFWGSVGPEVDVSAFMDRAWPNLNLGREHTETVAGHLVIVRGTGDCLHLVGRVST